MKIQSKPNSNLLLIFVSTLFFISGATGLILQVVWMYRLGLVFGNSAYASSATLAAFFLGLAAGGRLWGKMATKFKHSLRVYGLMEIGVALAAILWLLGLHLYELYFPSVVNVVGRDQEILTLIKFIFSILLLFLPTMLMGGTFPILVQYVSHTRKQMEKHGSMLYAVNTLGASVGTFIAGFILLSTYGVNATYYLAIFAVACIGFIALIISFITTQPSYQKAPLCKENKSLVNTPSISLKKPQVAAVAFLSGFLALSLEILWTRMFAQVLQNSVYSFAIVLVVFLISLGLAGILSHFLIRYSAPPTPTLIALFTFGAILTAFTPLLFDKLTGGMTYVTTSGEWSSYLISILRVSIIVILPPTILLGAIFPYLLKVAPLKNLNPGDLTGQLVLYNSLGSSLGPVITGFILLEIFGLLSSIKLMAVAYVFMAALFSLKLAATPKKIALTSSLLCVLIIGFMNQPLLIKLDKGEQMLGQWQASDGVVSVIKSGENIVMKLDNYYTLGDSESALIEQLQGHIPLLIHSNPKKVLFLGMGTGVTAGASLKHQVDKVVVTELIPNVVVAAKKYFSPLTNDLYSDSRVQIVNDDARNYLHTSEDKFDVIIGDLFTPWHAGTGSLYTLEHFRQVNSKLAVDGLFAQWLPLHQLTPETLGIISKTFATVFPQVTLWRADFSDNKPSIALIGQAAGTQLDNSTLQKNISNIFQEKNKETNHMTGLFYIGNYEAVKNNNINSDINVDDKRTIEFKAPILSYQASSGKGNYVTGEILEEYLSLLQKNLPPNKDPYVAHLPENEKRYIEVGLLYFKYLKSISEKREIEAKKLYEQIGEMAPDFLK